MISFAISFALGRIREKLHTMVSYNINRQMLVHIQQIPFSKTFFLDSSRITQQLQTDSNEIASYCMKPMYRDPLRLLAMGYTNREIAESLGLTDEVVRMRLFRGRKLLWKELSSHE